MGRAITCSEGGIGYQNYPAYLHVVADQAILKGLHACSREHARDTSAHR